MRLVTSLLAVSVLAALAAPSALAFRFTDETRIVPAGRVGGAYHHAIGTAAGCKGVRIAVENGGLPPGLRLVGDVRLDADGSNWRIEGVPTAPGAYSFWLRATSEWPECGGDSTEEPFTIHVGGAPAGPAPVGSAPAAPPAVARVAITTRRLPALRRSHRYALRLRTSGGTPIVRHGRETMRWKVERGALPIGLRLNTAVGKLIGTPRHAGRYRITVRVTDRAGVTARRTLVLHVRR